MPHSLSKSRYTLFRQCAKALWRTNHSPKISGKSDKLHKKISGKSDISEIKFCG